MISGGLDPIRRGIKEDEVSQSWSFTDLDGENGHVIDPWGEYLRMASGSE